MGVREALLLFPSESSIDPQTPGLHRDPAESYPFDTDREDADERIIELNALVDDLRREVSQLKSERRRTPLFATLAVVAVAGAMLARPLTLMDSPQQSAGLADPAWVIASVTLPVSFASMGPLPISTSAPLVRNDVKPSRVQQAPAGVSGKEFTGTLMISSQPSGAAVLLNQRHVGTTPLRLADHPAGTHAVWIEQAGYERWTAAVLVPAYKLTSLNVTLERR